jgi:hypothetical protein
MQTANFHMRHFVTFVVIFLMIGESCKKVVTPPEETIASATEEDNARKKPRNPPPPPPPVYFYFTNCTNPSFSGNFVVGKPASVTFTMDYINAPGTSYPAFASSTVNGITITAPAGVLNNGSGSIVFTASGTPPLTGIYTIPVSIGGSIACHLEITVLNAPPQGGNCSDPGPTVGSTGCITFTYRGQQVTYSTVRAADGKIWIQHNLGSPQVALHVKDYASAGDYFQWGRWDDGHQVPNSPTITGGASLSNPSAIPAGNPNFIIGSTTSTAWWGVGGTSADTWSGTAITATNGKDPCTALGTGWHMPGAAEWSHVMDYENAFDATTAFQSNLKLVEAGYRASSNGQLQQQFVGGYYWTSTASNTQANVFFFDDAYNMRPVPADRGYAFGCRCVKN